MVQQLVAPHTHEVGELVADIMQTLVEAGHDTAVNQLFERLFHLRLVDGPTAAERVPADERHHTPL